MSAKETIKKLEEILYDNTKCNAVKFEEMELVLLKVRNEKT